MLKLSKLFSWSLARRLLQDRNSTRLRNRLSQIALSVILGHLALISVLLLFAAQVQDINAAPPILPLAEIISDPVSVTHTDVTTHKMRVFADGRLTNQFFTDDGSPGGRNQIDQNNDDPAGTTVAVLFDQHPTTNTVDVGAQGDFMAVTPITLNTSSTIPGYIEDTQVTYASKALPYQITQRTLATSTHNCVLLELEIKNNGNTPLTGGRLLLMLDVDAAHTEAGDLGFYDAGHRFLYISDFNTGSSLPGFAVGAALLQGELAGYRVNGNNSVYPPNSYPTTDNDIRTQMLTPTNTITDGENNVLWMVAKIPTLGQNQDSTLVFNLCAKSALTEEAAKDDLINDQEQLVKFSATKTVNPSVGSAGQPVTYTISLVNNGFFYIDNVIVTDTLPASVNLVDYSVSQGTITAANGLITATVGRMYPGQPVNLTIVVTPSTALPNGTIITNQGFISSSLFFTSTNVASHQIVPPQLVVTKEATPEPVEAGQELLYTIVLRNQGQGDAFGVVVSDTLPSNTSFVTGSVTITPASAGGVVGAPPLLVQGLTVRANSQVTVTYRVRVDVPLPTGTLIINTVAVTGPNLLAPATATATSTVVSVPAIQIVKTGPATARVGDTVVFTFTVTNIGSTQLQNVVVEDNLAGPAILVNNGDGDAILDLNETWLYTAAYTIPPTAPDPLINVAVVTATDTLDNQTVATSTHTTFIEFEPVLLLTKQGPLTATVGSSIVFTFTVSHAGSSDGSPVSNVIITDTVAGPATYQSGDDGDDLLEAGELWIFTASYTPQLTDPSPLINIGTVQGLDLDGEVITATASHSTTLQKFNPVLSLVKEGPAVASVGANVVFTFTLSHAVPESDGSAVTISNVTDNVAGPATRLNGDNNNLLEAGEIWIYVVTYTIKPVDINPLENIATASGTDQENDPVMISASHTTALVGFGPVLFVDKDGPAKAIAGQTVVYTITVINYSDDISILSEFNLDPIELANLQPGDGSPIRVDTVMDNIAGEPDYVSGDTGGRPGMLDAGEGWVYTVTYTIKATDPNSLTNRVDVQGVDQEGDPLTASAIHTVAVSSDDKPGSYIYYFPVFLKKSKP